MAKSQAARTVKSRTSALRPSADDKVAAALKQASSQARKQLTLQGLKLPTQSWAPSPVRNPAV